VVFREVAKSLLEPTPLLGGADGAQSKAEKETTPWKERKIPFSPSIGLAVAKPSRTAEEVTNKSTICFLSRFHSIVQSTNQLSGFSLVDPVRRLPDSARVCAFYAILCTPIVLFIASVQYFKMVYKQPFQLSCHSNHVTNASHAGRSEFNVCCARLRVLFLYIISSFGISSFKICSVS
jgi:hypothetical protein